MLKLKKGKSSALKDKLFINEARLTVVGEKIKLLKLPGARQDSIALKTTSEDVETPPDLLFTEVKKNTARAYSNRTQLQLKTCLYKNRDLCNEKLKSIYEAREVEEFRRLLGVLKAPEEEPTDFFVTSVDVEGIYREFYQDYYDFLKDLCVKQKAL